MPRLVTTGLDPVVHAEAKHRKSERFLSMDCRVKPGNDDVRNRSRDASHPSHATNGTKVSPPKKRGGGAPTGASIHCPRHTSACCHANVLRARKRATPSDVATRKCLGRARLSALRPRCLPRKSMPR